MSGIKLSAMDPAGALGENDLLYVVRHSVEGGFESKKTTIGTLVGLLSGGLPDITVAPDHEAKTPEDFAQWVEERFIEEVPDKATNHTVYIMLESGESSLGTVTKFPTAAGCYYWVCGFNAIGQMTLDDILYYVSTDLPTARWPVGHISVPQATGGGGGIAGWPDLVVNSTGETKTPAEFYLWVNSFLAAPTPAEAINHTCMVKEPDSQQSSMGSMTIIPTANGCYYWMCGPNALGNGDVAEALMYIPDGGNATVLTYLTIPAGGTAGKDGNSITLKGSFEKYTDLPLPESNVVGDSWFVQTTLYSWDGGNWTNLGDFMGPQGPEGPMGAMVTIIGPFASVEELPDGVNVNSIATVGKFFYYFDGSAWNSLGDFSGPKGDKGDKGDLGNLTRAGTSGNWATNYSDNLAAKSAHGFRGASEYWKTTLSLDNVGYGVYPPVDVRLQKLPCDADGVPLPYTLHHEYGSGGSGKPTTLILVLWVHGTATQLLSQTTGEYSPLGLVDNVRYDPLYSMFYWY